MLERFTDYARAAVRAGFDRQPTASERDLLAALSAGRGVARRLLTHAGVTAAGLPAACATVERSALVAGAVAEARRRGASYVGTGHLLLALARSPGSALAGCGADAGRLDELLTAAEDEWRSHPSVAARVVAWVRAAVGRGR